MASPCAVVVLENRADDGLALYPRQRPQLREHAPRDLLELVGGQKVRDERNVITLDTGAA